MDLSKAISNSDDAMDALDYIKSLKPKEKVKALKDALTSPFFERVVIAAYDPMITYGIKKVAKFKTFGGMGFCEADNVFGILDKLQNRELTGNAAKNEIEELSFLFNERSFELITRILKKDLRAGFTAKTVNLAKPGLIEVFSCMLSHKYEEKRIKAWPVCVEEKFDGVRALIVIRNGKVTIHSREGRQFENCDHLKEVLKNTLNTSENGDAIDNMVFDGELITVDGFNETVGAVHRKGAKDGNLMFMAFDALSLLAFEVGSSKSSYLERRQILADKMDTIMTFDESEYFQVNTRYTVNSHEEIEHIYQRIRDRGGEGVIVKPVDGKYHCKRSYDWLKIKDRDTADLPIIGFDMGTGKNENRLGALVVDFNGVEVRVGGGLTDQMRDEIWNNQNDYLGRLIEVEYHELTADKSLRHPRFLKFRDDKPVEDGSGIAA